MCYIITTFLTKSLLQEESSIYKNMLYQNPKAYAVPFIQRGCCTQPQMLDYEGRKHIAPCTAGATAYAVLFFQRGYSAHPQILDYEGRKHTAPHTYTAEAAYAVHFFQRGYSAHPQILDYEGRKHTAPTHILLKQPTLYISCKRLLSTSTDSGLRRQETHSPPHIYC